MKRRQNVQDYVPTREGQVSDGEGNWRAEGASCIDRKKQQLSETKTSFIRLNTFVISHQSQDDNSRRNTRPFLLPSSPPNAHQNIRAAHSRLRAKGPVARPEAFLPRRHHPAQQQRPIRTIIRLSRRSTSSLATCQASRWAESSAPAASAASPSRDTNRPALWWLLR